MIFAYFYGGQIASDIIGFMPCSEPLRIFRANRPMYSSEIQMVNKYSIDGLETLILKLWLIFNQFTSTFNIIIRKNDKEV